MIESDVIIGTPVIYWNVIRKDGSKAEPLETVITSAPWKFGIRRRYVNILVMVEGVKRGVPISKLEKINN